MARDEHTCHFERAWRSNQTWQERAARQKKDESFATLTLPFLHIVCLLEQGKRDAWHAPSMWVSWLTAVWDSLGTRCLVFPPSVPNLLRGMAARDLNPLQHGKLKFVSRWIWVHWHFACGTWREHVTLKEHGVQTKADRSAQPDRKRWVLCYIDIAFPAYCLPNWTREERLLDSIGAYRSGCRSGCSGQRAGSFEKTTARPRQLGHPRGRLQLQGLVAQPGAAPHGNHRQSFTESLRMSLRMWHA